MRTIIVVALVLVIGTGGALAQEESLTGSGFGDRTEQQVVKQFRATSLIGQRVKSAEGDEIGEISDFVLYPDGQSYAAVIEIGAAPGMSDGKIVIPLEQFHLIGIGYNQEVLVQVAWTMQQVRQALESQGDPGHPSGDEAASFDSIFGLDVINQDDEVLGAVDDLILNQNGEIRSVIIGLGGFLGIGSRDVAIDVEEIEVLPEGYLLVATNRDQLLEAPDFEQVQSSRPPDLANGDDAEDEPFKPVRSYTGPHDFPPEEVGAYGIVAFPNMSTPATRDRHLMVCHAFVAALPASDSVSEPLAEQMVTVWPVNDEALADELNAPGGASEQMERCETAVDEYHLDTAQTALRQAGEEEETGITPDERGPFLLAWSPSSNKGKPGALVLVRDLSGFSSERRVSEAFNEWRIQSKEILIFLGTGGQWRVSELQRETGLIGWELYSLQGAGRDGQAYFLTYRPGNSGCDFFDPSLLD